MANNDYVDNDVFIFIASLNWDLANLKIPIYTNPSPKEWDNDYDPDLTLHTMEDMVEKAYFTPEHIQELKEALIKKIEECDNPFKISCCNYDGNYNVTEDQLFKIDWARK